MVQAAKHCPYNCGSPTATDELSGSLILLTIEIFTHVYSITFNNQLDK